MREARILLSAALCLAAGSLSGCVTVDLESLVRPRLQEHVVEKAREKTRDKILLIDVSGILSSRPGRFGFIPRTTPGEIKTALNRAELDKNIKAVILRVDSPGGEVTASDMIHQELVRFKARTGLPVYASIMGLGASGGYYVSTAADKIYAHPTTVTGSIGVIARFPKVKKLADKVGYEEVIIKSGKLKDLAHPLKDMSEEERKILEDMISELFDRFLDVCVAGRPGLGSREEVRALADGRIYTARQAKKHRLIDDISYLPDVIARIKKAAGLRYAHVVTYRYGRGSDLNIYARGGASVGDKPPLVHLDLGRLFGSGRAGFYYLWLPAAKS